MHFGVFEFEGFVELRHEPDGGLRNVVVERGVVLAAAFAVAIEIYSALGIEVDAVLPGAGFELAVNEGFAGRAGGVEIKSVARGFVCC
jgi:hypothetical protein